VDSLISYAPARYLPSSTLCLPRSFRIRLGLDCVRAKSRSAADCQATETMTPGNYSQSSVNSSLRTYSSPSLEVLDWLSGKESTLTSRLSSTRPWPTLCCRPQGKARKLRHQGALESDTPGTWTPLERLRRHEHYILHLHHSLCCRHRTPRPCRKRWDIAVCRTVSASCHEHSLIRRRCAFGSSRVGARRQ
jgi:hypothetical protein